MKGGEDCTISHQQNILTVSLKHFFFLPNALFLYQVPKYSFSVSFSLKKQNKNQNLFAPSFLESHSSRFLPFQVCFHSTNIYDMPPVTQDCSWCWRTLHSLLFFSRVIKLDLSFFCLHPAKGSLLGNRENFNYESFFSVTNKMRSEDFSLSKDLPALFFKIILWFFAIKFVIVSLSKTLIIITSTYWVLIVALTLIAVHRTLITLRTISTIIIPSSSMRKLRFRDIGWLV